MKTNDDLLNFNLVLQQICHKYLSEQAKVMLIASYAAKIMNVNATLKASL